MIGAIVIFLFRMVLELLSGKLTKCYMMRIYVHLCCILHVVVGFWQYRHERGNSPFADGFSTDIWLFERMSYSTHMRAFYVIFCTLSLVFGITCTRGVFCMIGAIVIFFFRMVLALLSGNFTKCCIMRIYVYLCCILHAVVGFGTICAKAMFCYVACLWVVLLLSLCTMF